MPKPDWLQDRKPRLKVEQGLLAITQENRNAVVAPPLSRDVLYALLRRCGFSDAAYLRAYPEVSSTSGGANAALNHFVETGVAEGRILTAPAERAFSQDELMLLQNAPIADCLFHARLLACFGMSMMRGRWIGAAQSRAPDCDLLTDLDIASFVATARFGGQPFFVFGDSHARLYARSWRISRDGRWLVPIAMTCTGGSARGLGNPEARLGYGPRLRRFFPRIERYVRAGLPCLFKFGQVDVEYIYPYQWSQLARRSFDFGHFSEFCDTTISQYVGFLSGLVPPPSRHHVYLCSICPPALSDEHWQEGYLNGQLPGQHTAEERGALADAVAGMEVPSLNERTELHKYFNDQLRLRAGLEGFGFHDDASGFLDESGECINGAFNTVGGGKDVHIDLAEPALQVIEAQLVKLTVGGTGLGTHDHALLKVIAEDERRELILRRKVATAGWVLQRPNGDIRSNFMVFSPDGGIIGYDHPNEVGWDMPHGNLRFLAADGRPTSILNTVELESDGNLTVTMVHPNNARSVAHHLHSVGLRSP
jgi:hypothetical protein